MRRFHHVMGEFRQPAFRQQQEIGTTAAFATYLSTLALLDA